MATIISDRDWVQQGKNRNVIKGVNKVGLKNFCLGTKFVMIGQTR